MSFFSSPTRDLRALWRLPLYVALLLIFSTMVNVLLEHIPGLTKNPNAPSFVFIGEFTGFIIVYIPAWILSLIERRPLGDYGLPSDKARASQFWQGCLFGLCEISLLMGLIAAFGGYSFGSWSLGGTEVLRWALTWAVVFLFVGLFEEFGFRGYVLHALSQLMGFWPAAILLAMAFGYVHSTNPGESHVGEFGIFCIALVFAFTLRRTGSLWLAVGWHAAFDFGETFLFSVPDSGAIFPGHLSNAYLHGPTWKTGGAAGPEASVFSFLVMAVLALVFHFFHPTQPVPLLGPQPTTPEPPVSLLGANLHDSQNSP